MGLEKFSKMQVFSINLIFYPYRIIYTRTRKHYVCIFNPKPCASMKLEVEVHRNNLFLSKKYFSLRCN